MKTVSGARCGMDRVIEAYKGDIDRSLLRENLRLSPDQRVRKLVAFVRLADQLKSARPQPR